MRRTGRFIVVLGMAAAATAGAAGIDDLPVDRKQHYLVCKGLFEVHAALIDSGQQTRTAYGRALIALETVQAVGFERELRSVGVVRVDQHRVMRAWARQVALSVELDALLARSGVLEISLLNDVEPATDVLWANLMESAARPDGRVQGKTAGASLRMLYGRMRDQVLQRAPAIAREADRQRLFRVLEDKLQLARDISSDLKEAGLDEGDLAANFAGAASALQRYARLCLHQPDSAAFSLSAHDLVSMLSASDKDFSTCMENLRSKARHGALKSSYLHFAYTEKKGALGDIEDRRVLGQFENVEVSARPVEGHPSLVMVTVKARISNGRTKLLLDKFFGAERPLEIAQGDASTRAN